MFRKHFRIRRVVLGLAFAAFAAPAAQASTGYMVDGGPAPVSRTDDTALSQSYLQYHQVGGPLAPPAQIRSENSQTASAITPLQADGLRWQAMADFYAQQVTGAATSERSNGVKGPDPSLVPQLVSATSSSFDWQDAGVGASTAFGVALLLIIGVAMVRRNQHTGLTSA